ncbi:unnamed protein product [Jaminaea pallidilutea]
MGSAGSDAYAGFKPGGSLKFKGGDSTSGGKKKHKKSKSSSHPASSSSSSVHKSASESSSKADRGTPGDEPLTGGKSKAEDDEPDVDKDVEPSSSSFKAPRKLTESEKRFAEVQRRRMADKVRKEAGKSHKERVAEFNKYLEGLSEHHDLPKVGPG